MIVLVKQVPDIQNSGAGAMTEEGAVNREALPAVFNPDDLYALEGALLLKDRFPGTTVGAITMGPPPAAAVLRECLYRGADFTALVSDRGFAGADTQATSYALACAIKKTGAPDLVFCGRQAIDGETAQVGPQTAEKLGLNQITNVSRIEDLEIQTQTITARRSVEHGWERVRTKFPVLLTFNAEGGPPRPPSAKRTMACKNVSPLADPKTDPAGRAVMALWDISAIKAEADRCGLAGSPTRIKTTSSVVLTAGEITYIDPGEGGVTELIRGLFADHILG